MANIGGDLYKSFSIKTNEVAFDYSQRIFDLVEPVAVPLITLYIIFCGFLFFRGTFGENTLRFGISA